MDLQEFVQTTLENIASAYTNVNANRAPFTTVMTSSGELRDLFDAERRRVVACVVSFDVVVEVERSAKEESRRGRIAIKILECGVDGAIKGGKVAAATNRSAHRIKFELPVTLPPLEQPPSPR